MDLTKVVVPENGGRVPHSEQMRRKLIEFDDETWQALDLLARDSMTSWQELADEAFRDLLKKRGRPTDLRTALRQSAKTSEISKTTAKTAVRRKGRT